MVNHNVAQRAKLLHDLPQTRCDLLAESNPVALDQVICVYVLCLVPFVFFPDRQVRRHYTRLRTGALVNQLILRLIKLSVFETDCLNALIIPSHRKAAPQQQCSLHE
jgi:hypothetical protein